MSISRRHDVRALTLLLALTFVLTTPCFSMGKNGGGLLMVHFDPSIEYEPTYPDPCYYNLLFPEACEGIDPDSCESYRWTRDCHYGTRLSPTLSVEEGISIHSDEPHLMWICAVFPDTTCVQIAMVELGLGRPLGPGNQPIEMVDYGHCGVAEETTPGWPGSDTGIRIWFDPPLTSHVVPLVWLAGVSRMRGQTPVGGSPWNGAVHFYEPGSILPTEALEPFPVGGWGVPGRNPDTGHYPLMRVCCMGGLCTLICEDDCLEVEGVWMNDELWCSPNPCDYYTPTESPTWGRIKSLFLTADDND